MPYVPTFTNLYNELETTRGESVFSVQIEFDQAKLKMETDMSTALLRRFASAAASVNAAFGAFMPYSAALELGYRHYLSGRWHKARPHLLPTIKENKQYILTTVSEGYRALLQRCLQNPKSAPSEASLRTSMEAIWESVLNGKVREDAQSLAQGMGIEDSGMHIASIRGFGKAPTGNEIQRWQSEFMQQRNAARSKLHGKSVADIVRKRGSLRRTLARATGKIMGR